MEQTEFTLIVSRVARIYARRNGLKNYVVGISRNFNCPRLNVFNIYVREIGTPTGNFVYSLIDN